MVCTTLSRAQLQQVTQQLENTKNPCTNQEKNQNQTNQNHQKSPSHIPTALIPSHEIQLGNTFLEQK